MWKDLANLARHFAPMMAPVTAGLFSVHAAASAPGETPRCAASSHALGKQQILRELGFLEFRALAAPVIARETGSALARHGASEQSEPIGE